MFAHCPWVPGDTRGPNDKSILACSPTRMVTDCQVNTHDQASLLYRSLHPFASPRARVFFAPYLLFRVRHLLPFSQYCLLSTKLIFFAIIARTSRPYSTNNRISGKVSVPSIQMNDHHRQFKRSGLILGVVSPFKLLSTCHLLLCHGADIKSNCFLDVIIVKLFTISKNQLQKFTGVSSHRSMMLLAERDTLNQNEIIVREVIETRLTLA